jgi:hypothetical protein
MESWSFSRLLVEGSIVLGREEAINEEHSSIMVAGTVIVTANIM